MNKSVLFLVTLVLFAFCSSSKSSSYTGIIQKLVQLNQVAGTDIASIVNLVNQIEAGALYTKDLTNGYFDDFQTKCNQGKQLLENFIQKLENDQIAAQARANQAQSENGAIEDELQTYGEKVANAQASIEAIGKEIEEDVAQISTYGVEAEKKLNVIKVLKDIIVDELQKPTEGNAFIQLKTFTSKFKELKTLLTSSKDNKFNPILTSLIALTESRGFTDQTVLQKILDVLNEIENNLRAFRKNQEESQKALIEEKKAQAKYLGEEFLSIVASANAAKAKKDNNDSIAQDAESDIEGFQKEIARKQNELDNFGKLCNQQEELRVENVEWLDGAASNARQAADDFTARP